jgi:hypothetical protein
MLIVCGDHPHRRRRAVCRAGGDEVIVVTALRSTAYAMGAGGPILRRACLSADDAASVLPRLRHRRGVPRLTVLATCPDSATCAPER